MEKVFMNSIHQGYNSHDLSIYDYKGRRIKVVYQTYNANEICETYLFDGNKWNLIFSLMDLGIMPTKGAYLWDESKRKAQAKKFSGMMIYAVKTLLDA